MAFPFLQRGNLADHAKQLQLAHYSSEIILEGLLTGVDNVRTDVYLSPKFAEATRHHIAKLLAKYGNVEDFLVEDSFSRTAASAAASPQGRYVTGGFIGSPKAAMALPGQPTGPQKPAEPADFKKVTADLHIVALNRAKAENSISLDLLTRLAVIKLLRSELTGQFSQLLERCRVKLKSYEGPRTVNPQKGIEMRERFAKLQITKKTILRKAGQDLFVTLREIEKETLAKMRRSLFGDVASSSYDLFLNRLLYTEDGRDDFLNAEHYVMLGNYDRDPDRFQTMLEYSIAYLKSLNLLPAGTTEEDKLLDAMLNVPENAQELMAGGTPDDNTPKGKAQRALLNGWVEFLEKENVMDHVVASYEVVPLLAQYSPPINPQQLKNSIISKTERKRVETLLDEHGKISPDGLNSAVKKVEGTKGVDRAKIAGRYLSDFIRYHRDFRRFEAVLSAMDGINVIGVANEKLRELSAIK